MRKCAECGVHRFGEEVATHGVCWPCIRKRQVAARVVRPEGGKRVTLAEIQRRIDERDARLRAHNLEAVRRVASACLPQQRGGSVDGALDSTNPQELATPRGSTTFNSGGSLGGCSAHSNG
jgi:hypothetical protein